MIGSTTLDRKHV